jgi:hypothetical protein
MRISEELLIKYPKVPEEVIDSLDREYSLSQLDSLYCIVEQTEDDEYRSKGFDSESEFKEYLNSYEISGDWRVTYIFKNKNPIKFTVRTVITLEK